MWQAMQKKRLISQVQGREECFRRNSYLLVLKVKLGVNEIITFMVIKSLPPGPPGPNPPDGPREEHFIRTIKKIIKEFHSPSGPIGPST
jgi:hypothetical protein